MVSRSRILVGFLAGAFLAALSPSTAGRQAGTVRAEQKISEIAGGFGGVLDVDDNLGESLTSLEDLDGDGTFDLAVGVPADDDGGLNQGAVWILFLNADGTVASEQKISGSSGGFGGILDPSDLFGISVASLGDLDGDGNTDLAVGALSGGDADQGAVWILFLNADGTVASEQQIGEGAGGFGGDLDSGDNFGGTVSSLGDVDGDGNPELAVGASADDDGGTDQGAVWILFLNANGTVASEQKINETTGGFGGTLAPSDYFGISVAALGDLDGDGNPDLAAGARNDDDGGSDQGAVWILFLDVNGTVASEQKISETAGGFGGTLAPDDLFGDSVASLGDLDGGGTPDLAVGAIGPDGNQGSAWIVFLNADGTVASEHEIDETTSGFGGNLAPDDLFGDSVAALGDLDGDGIPDLAVGASEDDDGGTDQGAVWILFLERPEIVLYEQAISGTAGGFGGSLLNGDAFGFALESLGDLDSDGIVDVAVGATGDSANKGAVWILFLDSDGTVKNEQKIADGTGGFTGTLVAEDRFGYSLANLGDLDGDGIVDLAVGAAGDGEGGLDRNAVWILFLDTDGTVKGQQEISETAGNFSGDLSDDTFGAELENLGDLDGDGVTDLAVGATGDDDGGVGGNADRGAVWILFLEADGTVDSHAKISSTTGGFVGPLEVDDSTFGYALAALGDLDGAGPSPLALAVGEKDHDPLHGAGAVWVLFLEADGNVLSEQKIKEGVGGFTGDLHVDDGFHHRLENLGSVGGPGVVDIAVGTSGDGDGSGPDTGAVWILSLAADGTVLDDQKISAVHGGFAGSLVGDGNFGRGLAQLGDLDGDGRTDIAVGAPGPSSATGAVWILFLNDGTLALGANATTWTGATDTQWELANNWGNGVPDLMKTAIIPDATTTPNDPAVTATGQQCDSLWIQSGGTLDIDSSSGSDGLGVFGGATVSGPITGTGRLVFEAPGTLGGNATIGLSFTPFAVRADADLELQGGPLSITGSFLGNTDVLVASGATIDIGGTVQIASDFAIDGSLTIGDGLDVGGTLSSSSSGELVVMGSGACVVAGQLCFHGDVTTSCSLSVERSTADTSEFEATNGWPTGVSIDVPGTVDLLTADLVIGGDLLLENGTLALGVDSKITTGGTAGIRIADTDALDPIAFLEVGDHLLQVPATEGITVGDRGKLNVGAGGELQLAGTLTVESGGALCLNGVPADRASLTSYLGNRYTLTLDSGSTLAAKGFAFSGMTSSGIAIGSGVTLAAAPLDLRGGLFDDPAPGGALLDIERSTPTQLRYLRFDNSSSASGVKNVRTSLASSVLTLVNWSGDLASDATTAESFDDDPGESSPPERIVWAPPESSDVQDFTASWGQGYVRTAWQTLSEVDSESFLVLRSPEPPGLYTNVGETPSVGASSYELHDSGASVFAAWRYRLYERLTHGELRLIDEVMLPASDIVLRSGGNTPTPPSLTPAPIVVGPAGTYPDVRTALLELARSGQSAPVTLELARGTHAPFTIGRGLAFDLCLVAPPGAVIDAFRGPLRIEDLSAERSLELVGLAVDARRGRLSALEVGNTRGVVLLQDVRVRGNASAPAAQLVDSTAVVFQGGAIEGVLALDGRSRATASSTGISALELTGRSALETRGASPPAFVESGSIWLAHAAAPRLTVSANTATIEAGCSGLAWLGVAPGLGFRPLGRPLLEGLLLLDPAAYSGLGAMRELLTGRASWELGPLPPDQPVYLQGFVFDPASGRICLSDVVRAEDRP